MLLSPMHRYIDPIWKAFAKVPCEHDHTTQEIVSRTFMAAVAVTSPDGKYSNVQKKRRDYFENVRDHEDRIIGQIVEIGNLRSDKRYYRRAKEVSR